MGKKKINNNFTKAYSQMESQCQEKFGVSAGGVNKYIERLESARFAPDREDVLGKLSMYQNLSQRFENDPSAAKRVKEISKSDIQWVKKFGDSVKKKNVPLPQERSQVCERPQDPSHDPCYSHHPYRSCRCNRCTLYARYHSPGSSFLEVRSI